MRRAGQSDAYRAIYAVVRQIPRGQVATYGQVAILAELPGRARQVGYALHALRSDAVEVPWHRVINARGEISPRASAGPAEQAQRQLLEAEGLVFDAGGRIDLDRYRWKLGAG